MSKVEDYPWIQWQLPRSIRITGISIYTVNGYYLGDVEVRVGINSINSTFDGNITVNDVCGSVQDPFRNRRKMYEVTCNSTMLATYITVQIKRFSTALTIGELRYTTEPRALFGNICSYIIYLYYILRIII